MIFASNAERLLLAAVIGFLVALVVTISSASAGPAPTPDHYPSPTPTPVWSPHA